MQFEPSPDCRHDRHEQGRRVCRSCARVVEQATAFEVPDLRKLVASGKYSADRVRDGHLRIQPVDFPDDEGEPVVVYDVYARAVG
jgi:hypothetical protein